MSSSPDPAPGGQQDPLLTAGNKECGFCEMTQQHHPQCVRRLPKRIILVRHGESQGNLDMSAYTTTPDYRIPLTPLGAEQARSAGSRIRDVVSSTPDAASDWKVYFYVSPYARTRATLREVGCAFPRDRVIGVREECRVREQDFGNFQVEERMRAIKETRQRFGRFFFRFPEGESAADVFDRVASKPPDSYFVCSLCKSDELALNEYIQLLVNLQASWSRCGATSTWEGWSRAAAARPTW
jgi:phosphohistidine phosphatase SixA